MSYFVLDVLAKSTLLLVTAWVVARSWRRHSAAERHSIWAAVLLSLLALPLLRLALPPLEIPMLLKLTEPSVIAEARSSAPITHRATDTVTGEGHGSSKAAKSSTGPSTSAGGILFGIWLLGAGLGIGTLTIGYGRLRWITHHGRDLTVDPTWSPLIGAHRPGADRVRWISHPKIRSPMTWGWIRPVIAMPADAGQWSESERSSAIEHELAHVERHDWLIGLAMSWACAAYWFHPLVWLAARRACLEAEKAADDRVLRGGALGPDYAEQLVTLARTSRRRTGQISAAVAMARAGELQSRIIAILDTRTRRNPMKHVHLLTLLGTAAALLTIVASSRLVHAEPRGAESGGVLSLFSGAQDPADPEEESLFRAAENGDIARARYLLDGGTDPNALIPGDGTALIAAARQGHQDMVELLLSSGARPDLGADGDGNPLIAAAYREDARMLRTLLDAGADPDAAVEGDGSAMIAAARRDNTELLNMLLDAGADIDKVVPRDENPLIQAAWGGRINAVELLLERGADVNLSVMERSPSTVEKRYPLKMARRGGHADIVELLLNHGAVEQH